MTSTSSHTTRGLGRPLLIAVTGLQRGTGVTTTTVALAHGWPGPEPAVVVEADPAGGQLANLVAADPYQGLASMARDVHSGARSVHVADHLQVLPGGLGFLAAPPGPDAQRARWVTMLLTGRDHNRRLDDLAAWRDLGATVFADCGAPGPSSAEAPILTAADACLILVRGDLTDPALAGQRIRELAGGSRHPGVLLIGAQPNSDTTTRLNVPVLARIPRDRHSAEALLRKPLITHRRNRLVRAASAIAATVDTQLRPATPVFTDPHPSHRRPPARGPGQRARLPERRSPARPTVYRLELPTGALPEPARARTPPLPEPDPTPLVRDNPTTTNPRHEQSTDQDTSAGDTEAAAEPAPRPPTVPPDPMPGPPAAADGRLLVVQLFGPTQLWLHAADAPRTEITGRLQPQSLELLAVLALHPGGVTRDELLEALWAGHLPAKPNNALTNAISRLRIALGAATGTDGHATVQATQGRARYRLDPAHVRVDYWDFTDAVTARRRATNNEDRAAACQRIIDIATAPLAPDLSQPWIEPMREATRRDALNAVGWLASHTVTNDPRTTLDMLETAAETDPYNEALWQDILRLHAKLGEYDALTRTYMLLSRKLTEIDATPSRETQQLLHHLQHTTR
ncbi:MULTISPECIES: BTAD domain-containing putative transcriptional regulator [Nocardia]|uniref:Helix-turn-helix domain-containing protein n=1 Tax=Nocardia nova TaxID=37330 RepID=A0A2T2YQE3_9NOCA|nr:MULTISPECIES: BTAD domain-containing putative transcriptional regulator [Nocardia]PSR57706.1 helix-turn-helix domain-containing protein [Nocardia nova]